VLNKFIYGVLLYSNPMGFMSGRVTWDVD